MYQASILAFLSLASYGTAQWLNSIPGIPVCAISCSIKFPAECGQFPTAKCICSNTEWMNAAQCCTQAACSSSDLALTQQYAVGICKYVNIDVKKPTSCVATAPNLSGNNQAGSSTTQAASAAAPSATLGGYAYQGCWKDGTTGPALDGGIKTVDQKAMSQDSCINHCKTKNYQYAALTNAAECFCANQGIHNNAVKQPDDSKCNSKCTGNSAQTCGAYGFVAAWKKV